MYSSKKAHVFLPRMIKIFSVILRQYRYIGSLVITIPRYNDLISLYCIYERDNLLYVIINYLFGILQVDNY